MATAKVIRYLRRKGASGFDNVTWLGSEQRFVAPLRNSSNNNLEEQYLLGTDTYTIEYEGEDSELDPATQTIVTYPAYITEKYYCIMPENDPLDNEEHYYKLITYKYKNAITPSSGYFFGEDTIYLPDKPTEVMAGDGTPEHPDIETLYCETPVVFNQYASELQIFPDYSSRIPKDELWWVGAQGTMDTLISTKKTYVKYDNSDRKITQEVITKAVNA